jgi:amidophosphoribosyltransferase
MCGILGCVIGRKKGGRTDEELEQIRQDFSRLLVSSEVRGTDAAGALVVNPNDETWYYKAPVAASEMVKDPAYGAQYWNLMDQLDNETSFLIGHTRAATHGSPSKLENDHPLISGSIVGVHNGVIPNHEEMKKEYGDEKIEVDSQALFAHMRFLSEKKDHMETKDFREVFEDCEGVAAVAAVDLRRPDVMFLGRNTNPIVLRDHANRKLLWFASTCDIMKGAFGKGTDVVAPPNSVARLTRGSAGSRPKGWKGFKRGRKVEGGAKDIVWSKFVGTSMDYRPSWTYAGSTRYGGWYGSLGGSHERFSLGTGKSDKFVNLADEVLEGHEGELVTSTEDLMQAEEDFLSSYGDELSDIIARAEAEEQEGKDG